MNRKQLFLVCLFFCTGLQANFICRNFSNDGIMSGNESRVLAPESLDNNGTIEGSKSVYIECGRFTGHGLIKGPKIEIIALEFNFVGTIDCSGECTIITTKAVNQLKLKKKGKGKFTFKVDKKLELPCEKPTNPLPTWWKGLRPSAEQSVKTHKICRLCVQIDVDKKHAQSAEWQEVVKQAKKVASFIDFDYRFSRSVLRDLHELLNALAYQKMQEGAIEGVTCTASSKVLSFDEIATTTPDAHLAPTAIVIAVFVCFDASKPLLAELFSERPVTALEAVNLYFDGSLYALEKNLADTLSANFSVLAHKN